MSVGCILFRNGYQLASGTGTLPMFASKVGGVVLKPQSEQAKPVKTDNTAHMINLHTFLVTLAL